jgi:hypothetical protein
MTDSIVIDRRFCGPPDSANGGYACGAIAAHVGAAVEVRLHRPPPLDRPMSVKRTSEGVRVSDGDALVGEGRPVADVGVDLPASISLEDAEAAGAAALTRTRPEEHAFPTCFVCGPAREPGDGFRVFHGQVPDRPELVAATWVPDESVDAGGGEVSPLFVWSVLDCTSGFGGADFTSPEASTPHVLGTMAADIRGAARVGEPYIAVGWKLGAEGRKLTTAAALLDPDGDCVGVARAIWIRLR